MRLLDNRYFHLGIYIVYIILGTTGIIFSYVGWFVNIHNEFYILFTNQTNIIGVICVACLLVSAIIDIAKKKTVGREERFVSFAFCCFIYLTITMILYNVFSPDGHIFTIKFWSTVQCPVLHLFAPVLFIFIFLGFTNKDKISKLIPLYVVIYPLLYSIFIFVRAAILGDVEEFQISGYIKFPYPIFDYDNYPIWLICLFMAIGVVLFIGLAILLRFIFQRKKKALAG